MSNYKVAAFCTCGGSVTGNCSNKKVAEEMEENFYFIHFGEGHESTDAKGAAKARKKLDG